MDFLAARAMEVARLTEDQLKSLQQREKMRGYLIPSWNIQQVFRLATLKEHYGIPDEPKELSAHMNRIGQFLKEGELLHVESDQHVYSRDLDAMHSFDWGIWHRQISTEFYYQGSSTRKPLKRKFREEE